MKNNIIPVVFTAALTSVGTLFAVKHFSKNDHLFENNNRQQIPVNYVNYSADKQNISAPPIDFRNAAEGSVKAVVLSLIHI